MDDLVGMLYDISTLIPDQSYRDIMDKLDEINKESGESPRKMVEIGRLTFSEGISAPIYGIYMGTEQSILIDRIDRLTTSLDMLERRYNAEHEEANHLRRTNHWLAEQNDQLEQQVDKLTSELECTKECNYAIELAQARQKIDQLTKLNKKARFNR